MIWEKDVQKRILKAILINGSETTSREISNVINMKNNNVRKGIGHLLNRGLIFVIKPEKTFPKGPDKYILNEKSLNKIKQLISEIGRDG